MKSFSRWPNQFLIVSKQLSSDWHTQAYTLTLLPCVIWLHCFFCALHTACHKIYAHLQHKCLHTFVTDRQPVSCWPRLHCVPLYMLPSPLHRSQSMRLTCKALQRTHTHIYGIYMSTIIALWNLSACRLTTAVRAANATACKRVSARWVGPY